MATRVHVGVGLSALALAVAASAAPAPVEPVRWEDHPAFAAQAAAAAQARPTPGALAGQIRYEGTAPAPRAVRMGSDPICVKEGAGVTSEILLVGPGGGLQNVLVYVKDGLGNRTFPPPTGGAVLDQKGCRYIPHVFGVQVNQAVRVTNSDTTLHNVHVFSKNTTEINFSQMKGTPAVTKLFTKPEVGIAIRCDVHGWMNGYVGVFDHPFFTVTKADGTFEIRGLPAGSYTIEAWHERLGTQTQKVTVDGKGTGTAAFSFKPRV